MEADFAKSVPVTLVYLLTGKEALNEAILYSQIVAEDASKPVKR